eukprot:scaffold287979_cov22-Tisochrysis_lutea.AAC.1
MRSRGASELGGVLARHSQVLRRGLRPRCQRGRKVLAPPPPLRGRPRYHQVGRSGRRRGRPRFPLSQLRRPPDVQSRPRCATTRGPMPPHASDAHLARPGPS